MRPFLRALFLSLGLLVFASCFNFIGRNYLDNGDIDVFCGMDYAAKYNWEKELAIVIGSNAYKDPISRYATAEELGISIKNDELDLSSLFQAKHSLDAGAKRIEFFYTGYSGDNDADVPVKGDMEVWISADVLSDKLEPNEDGTEPEGLYVGTFYFKRNAQAIFDEEALSHVLSFDCTSPVSIDNAKEIPIILKGAKFKACQAQEIDWFTSLPSGIKVYQLATEENSIESVIKFVVESASFANPIPFTQKSVKPSCVIPSNQTTLNEGIRAGENLSIFVAKKLSDRKVLISDCATLAAPGWDVEKRGITITIDGDCISKDISALDHTGQPRDFTSIIKSTGSKGRLPNGVKLYLQDDIKAGDTEFKVYLKGTLAQEDESEDSEGGASSSSSTSSTTKTYIDNTLYQFNLKLNGTDFDDSAEGLQLLSRPDGIETVDNTLVSTKNEKAYFYVCRVADLSYKILNPKPSSKFSMNIAIGIDNKLEQIVSARLFSNELGDWTSRLKNGADVTSWVKNDFSSVIKDFKATIKTVELLDYNTYKMPVITLELTGEVLDIEQDFEEPLAILIPHDSLPWTSEARNKSNIVPFGDIQVAIGGNCKFNISAE